MEINCLSIVFFCSKDYYGNDYNNEKHLIVLNFDLFSAKKSNAIKIATKTTYSLSG